MNTRRSLFSGLKIKPVKVYNTNDMKKETQFPDVAKHLENIMKRYELPKDKVVIFDTNKSFYIAYCNGNVRVTQVNLSPIFGEEIKHDWVELYNNNQKIVVK